MLPFHSLALFGHESSISHAKKDLRNNSLNPIPPRQPSPPMSRTAACGNSNVHSAGFISSFGMEKSG